MPTHTEPLSSEAWFPSSTTAHKGYVVGRGPQQWRSDGTSWSRPKLIEVEAAARTVAVAIGGEIVWLTPDEAEQARDLLNDALEAMS